MPSLTSSPTNVRSFIRLPEKPAFAYGRQRSHEPGFQGRGKVPKYLIQRRAERTVGYSAILLKDRAADLPGIVGP